MLKVNGMSKNQFYLHYYRHAIIGTLQEWKAEKSAQSLQALLRIMAHVRRDRHGITVDAGEIVPGDIILLQ